MRANYRDLSFEIKKEEDGYFLFVYREGKNIADHWQPDADKCKQFAFDQYGVPDEAWSL